MAWNEEDYPSVVMWSLENECSAREDPAVYLKWITDLYDAVKAIDPQQRPVTWASHTTHDPGFGLADVIGFNEYFGYRYGSTHTLGKRLDAVHSRYPGKPILITENGSYAAAGDRGPATKQGTEDFQAAQFKAHWRQVVARKSFMAGYTFWVLKDYKERLSYNRDLNGISQMGMMTFDEKPKLVYRVFKASHNPEP